MCCAAGREGSRGMLGVLGSGNGEDEEARGRTGKRGVEDILGKCWLVAQIMMKDR